MQGWFLLLEHFPISLADRNSRANLRSNSPQKSSPTCDHSSRR